MFDEHLPTAESIRTCFGHITVEPILFMYHFAGSFQWPTVDALIYHKVCMNLYNASVCAHLSTVEHMEEEDTVQAHTSYWYLANNLCFEVPSIMTSFIYGNLSDNFSRKTALVLPLLGQMITLLIYIINSIFMSIPIGFILIGPLLSGTFGGWISCNLAAYSYLSDISTNEDRSVRIAIGESMSAISVAIGYMCSGVALDSTNFAFVLALSFSLYTVAFIYAKYCVKDLNTSSKSTDEDTTPAGCIGVIKSVCSRDSITQAVTVIFKKRIGQHRAYIIILLFGMLAGILTGSSDWLIGYLFLRRQPLSWTQSLYGYYVGWSAFSHGFALICIMPLLKRRLHMSDTGILIFATFLQAVSEAVFGFSTVSWMVFLVPVFGFLADARPTCSRALLSTLVDRRELGKIFAVVGSLQSTGTLLASFIYNSAYPATLKYWAGLCFVTGAAFTFIPIAMFVWVHVDMKKEEEQKRLALQLDSEESEREELVKLKADGKPDTGDDYYDMEEMLSNSEEEEDTIFINRTNDDSRM